MEVRVSVATVATGSKTFDVQKAGEFKDFKWREEHIEELLANGAMLFRSGDVKIIGRQVSCDYNGIADIIGLKKNGDLVVVEVKRDVADLVVRKEPCEMQVIRYASGLSSVKSIDGILDRCYVAFRKSNVELAGKDDGEVREILFMEIQNHLHKNAEINRDQQLIVIASGFDPGIISACNWLLSKNVVINCMQISPFSSEDKKRVVLVVDRVFPLETFEELQRRTQKQRENKAKLMLLDEMFDLGIISAGQRVFLKDGEAEIISADTVRDVASGREMSWNKWATEHKEGSFSIYRYISVGSKTGATLHYLRTYSQNGDLPFAESNMQK